MCYAGNCNPLCDNCRPKFKACPECGAETALTSERCYKCGYEYEPRDFDVAVEGWALRHPGRPIELEKPFG